MRNQSNRQSTPDERSSTNEALLSSAEGFTAFSFGGYNIRFRAPYSLERYVDVLRWDDASFLKPIKNVRVAYA